MIPAQVEQLFDVTAEPAAKQRLIGGVSKMMLDRFFACLQSKLATHAG